MIKVDDRTEAERKTHPWLIVGTDRVLSGWGKAHGGKSYAAWAARPTDVDAVLRWVQARGDMSRVRVVIGEGYRARGARHLHIYVVKEDHPALSC